MGESQDGKENAVTIWALVDRTHTWILRRISHFLFFIWKYFKCFFTCKNNMSSLFLKISSKIEEQKIESKKKKKTSHNLTSFNGVIVDKEESILLTFSLCLNKICVAIFEMRLLHNKCYITSLFFFLNIPLVSSEIDESILWHLRVGLVLQLEIDVLVLNINNFIEHRNRQSHSVTTMDQDKNETAYTQLWTWMKHDHCPSYHKNNQTFPFHD